MISIENCVTIEVKSLNAYIQSSNERMLKEVNWNKVLREKDEGKEKERPWKKGSKFII